MRTMKSIALGVAAVLFASSLPFQAFAQSPLHYSNVTHEVFAMYYPWYGKPNELGVGLHWGRVHDDRQTTANTKDYPAQGAYDSRDPDLIDSQIDLAKSNGITGFISSWWGQKSPEDRAFQTVLERAEKKNFNVSIYWEKEDSNPKQIDNAVSDLVYILTNYGTNTAFLKVDGKPVVFVYERVLQQVPLESWATIITQTRAKAGGFFLIADDINTNNARLFNGIHRYNISPWVAKFTQTNNLDQLRDYFATNYSSAVRRAHQYGHIACVTVTPGYNDTKVRKPGRIADRKDGEVYRTLWEDAIQSNPDWILITSWNEWHEGTEIEPSIEYGDKYIKLTGDYASQFLASQHN
jgi:glycoprotein endo-alpha-1,2-mannosidase